MSTNDDITRRDFAKMTAAVTVVASGALGAGSRAAKAAAPAQAMTASDAIGAVARGDLTAEEYAGALLARADELKDLNACILLNRSKKHRALAAGCCSSLPPTLS
jgi:glutamate 5-kinase